LRSPFALAPVLLWVGAAAQLAMFWLWHAPALSTLPHPLRLALHLPLLASALLFWCAVAGATRARWQAVLALLLTGKLTCLLAVLLVFSPRPLHPHAALADQQLAGLLMLVACPLSYLGAALLITLQTVGLRHPHATAAARTLPAPR
jgi:putative membrane protein